MLDPPLGVVIPANPRRLCFPLRNRPTDFHVNAMTMHSAKMMLPREHDETNYRRHSTINTRFALPSRTRGLTATEEVNTRALPCTERPEE